MVWSEATEPALRGTREMSTMSLETGDGRTAVTSALGAMWACMRHWAKSGLTSAPGASTRFRMRNEITWPDAVPMYSTSRGEKASETTGPSGGDESSFCPQSRSEMRSS